VVSWLGSALAKISQLQATGKPVAITELGFASWPATAV
jgi:hypothetical protein